MVKAIIIDPALRDEGGHHLTMSIELSKAARSLGHAPVWLAHRDLDRSLVPDFVRFVPAFSSSIYERQIGFVGQLLRPAIGDHRVLRSVFAEAQWQIRLRRRMAHGMLNGDRARELIAALEQVAPERNDHLIVHSADPQTLDMLISWAQRRTKSDLPSFHVRTCWAGKSMPFANYGGGFSDAVDRLSTLSQVLTVSAETPAGADQLARELGRRVDLCRYLVDDEIGEISKREDSARQLVIGWLGGPRPERGSILIPGIIRTVLASKPDRELKFLLQCAGRTSRKSREFDAQLSAFGDAVERLQVSISREAYLRALERCDVILLPYDPHAYPRERGSGAAIEALLTGKPIVTTDGTFAASLVSDGNGLIGSDATSLGQCILNIEAHFEQFRRAAVIARDQARQHYDRVQNYLSLLGQSRSSDS